MRKEISKQITKEIFEVISYGITGAIFLVNILCLIVDEGHWKDILIAHTVSIPLVYLVVYVACRLGDKD